MEFANELEKTLRLEEIAELKKRLEELGVRTIEREGVFIVIRDPENKSHVLLVKHGYGTKKWSLPGGGIKQAEFAINAAKREALDETGLNVEIEPIPIAHLSLEIKYGFTLLFAAKRIISGEIRHNGDGKEITECKYFHVEDLPEMYNAQRGMVGWAQYCLNGIQTQYGHPNKPPLKEYATFEQPR